MNNETSASDARHDVSRRPRPSIRRRDEQRGVSSDPLQVLAERLLRGSLSEQLPAMNVGEVLGRLPEPDRVILSLRTFEELTNRQAAEVLGVDPAAARKRYLDALLRLRDEWQKSPAARAFWGR